MKKILSLICLLTFAPTCFAYTKWENSSNNWNNSENNWQNSSTNW